LPPIVEHPHSEAASITGGYVYRGKRIPELSGAYIYGDWETGKIWGLKAEARPSDLARRTGGYLHEDYHVWRRS
jgi:hypothetical protein